MNSTPPNGATAQRPSRLRAFLVFALMFTAATFAPRLVRADGLPYTFTKVGPEYRLTLQPSTSLYFGFQQTADLLQEWNTIQLSLGGTGPIFGYTPAVSELRAFLRARGSGQ